MNQNKLTQSTFNTTFDFGNTNDFSIDDTLNTTTHGTNFTLNPFYSCRCRHISLFNDPYSWRGPEEFCDCNRADIARAYRLIRSGF